jgi:hypothetical protein
MQHIAQVQEEEEEEEYKYCKKLQQGEDLRVVRSQVVKQRQE